MIHAVTVAMRRDGRLLTAGERRVVDALLAASQPAQALLARLAARRPAVFWLDELAYSEIPDIGAAAAELTDAALAWSASVLPPAWLASSERLPALRAACRALGRPTSGRKADVVARLSDSPARAVLLRPGIWLRHRRLWRRLARLFLHDHRGDLAKLVVARLGHVTPVAYAPTGGGGLFPRRRDLLAYEAGLRRRATLEGEALLGAAPAALVRFEAARPAPDWRARFAARRFDEALVHAAARLAERGGAAEEAAGLYRRLLAREPRSPGQHAVRLALCLDRLGDPAAGARVCAEWLDRVPRAAAVALERTGRRLSRRARIGWAPLPPLRTPTARTLQLSRVDAPGRRPRWGAADAPLEVEPAVVALLAEAGRAALWGEGAPWSSLFGVLFRPALFAAVPGMLPAPLLGRPLDLGTPGFRARRAGVVAEILDGIRSGDAPVRIAQSVSDHGEEAIAGVHWAAFPPATLVALARAVPGPALAAVMEAFVDDWRGARRGMPDLCVLPGPAVRLPGARPARLSDAVVFVEVKGPGDAIRDEQAVWMDRLLRAGVGTEVWKVVPAASSGPAPSGGPGPG